MNVCVYDNPETMRRECWNNGELQWFITAEMLLLKEDFISKQMKSQGKKFTPWKRNQFLDGNKSAMYKKVEVIA